VNEIVRTPDKHLRQVASVQELLVNKQAMDQLGKVAARHMNPERMMRVIANAIRTTPDLAKCEPLTLLGALMQCATLGLEPNTPMGHAYLIPFKNTKRNTTEVTLIVGYKGLADMARRSGQVTGIHSDVVYDDDELWDYEYGSEARLRHKPGPRNGKKLAAYCHAKLTDGEAFVVLPWAEVEKVRNASQGYKRAVAKGDKTAPWIAHEDAMARKTALRALANRGELPVSVEFMQASDVDEAAVDYKSFAANPDDGPLIEGTLNPDDDAGGDVGGEETPHDPETGEITARASAAPKPAARKPAATPGPVVVTAPRRKELEALRDKILQNAEVDAATAATFHDENGDLGALAAEAPDLHKEVIEELEAFKTAQAQGGTE
jgi:recombination protein RecT